MGRRSSKKKELKIKHNVAIPLLICDVVKAEPISWGVFSIEGKLEFKLCFLSARIMGFASVTERYNTYVLEDGSACIEMSLFKDRNRKFADSNRNPARFYHKPQLMGTLRNMMASAKKIMDFADIILGTPLLVLGRISLVNDNNIIVGNSLWACKNANRDMEIAYKDYLYAWYKQKERTLN